MKLWLLRPIKPEAGPWDPWYDKCFGFVVRAETETDARALAQGDGGDEISGPGYKAVSAWTNPAFSTCVEVSADGPEGIILSDVRSA